MIWTNPARRLTVVLSLAVALLLPISLALRAFGHKTSPAPDRLVADFTIADATTGHPVSLHDFPGAPIVVLVFLGIDCPIGELYLGRLNELCRSRRKRGVAFLGINSNALDSAAEVAEHARKNDLLFPMLKDHGNVVADQFRAERQCEVIVLDAQRRTRYRGAIDDQYRIGARKDATTVPYLADAIDALLANRKVPVVETTVFGCLIERVKPKARRAANARALPVPAASIALDQVTYSEQVAPIFQRKCQACHRPGQIGPFALLTYHQARRRAAMIREVVDNLRMPPWHADPRYGHFENDRRLTDRERATILAWVDQGTPQGDLAHAPPPRTFPEGWTIGTPDVIIPMAEPYTVAAEGVVPYQRFRVATGFTEEKWVQAAEIRPGDRAVVHHVFAFIEKHADAPSRHKRRGPVLAGYAPGDMPSVFPPGTARRIPAGSDLLLEIHYTPTGRERTDRTSVGLIFARTPATREAITEAIHPPGRPRHRLRIPPGAENYEARGSYTFAADAHLLSMMPHMHLRGKDFRYDVTYPDGRSEVLLSVPAFDFAWQSVYRLAEPKALPKGTRIDCLAHFDNSAGNPANPDPTATVRWGDYTWDEMMIGYLDYSRDQPTRGNVAATDAD